MSEKNGYLPYPKGFATTAIHHAQEPEQWDSMAVVAPIVTSTTYKQYGPTNFQKYQYARVSNPTRGLLEKVLAKLDNADYGLTFASGMGATMAVLGLLKSGDHLISGIDFYSGTNNMFKKVATNFGIEVSFVDFADLSNFEKCIKKNSKLVWIESPTNPMMQVVDIKAATEIAKNKGLISVVDNTFLTCYLLRPLDFGADIVSYSLTKYMNGHSDVVMGALVTSSTDLYQKLRSLQISMGAIPSPRDCYQVNRGLKTLALRMQQHNKNGLIVAKYLDIHPKIEKVLHPGLPSHPQYELLKQQASGTSGTFSFYLKGTLETSRTFLTSLKIFGLAGSLGGYESLAELPATMSHSSVPPEDKATLGISDTLIRLSVGIEDVDDLIADLEQALSAA